jgi:hypothetical protein
MLEFHAKQSASLESYVKEMQLNIESLEQENLDLKRKSKDKDVIMSATANGPDFSPQFRREAER